nr:hydrophobic ligand binding protein [Hymenolepis microstoma]
MNPIRRFRTKVKEFLAERERFYDEDPLGKKIASYLSKWREIVSEVRGRLRERLRKYLDNLEKEFPNA